jgi:hypothetical protein
MSHTAIDDQQRLAVVQLKHEPHIGPHGPIGTAEQKIHPSNDLAIDLRAFEMTFLEAVEAALAKWRRAQHVAAGHFDPELADIS